MTSKQRAYLRGLANKLLLYFKLEKMALITLFRKKKEGSKIELP